MTTIPPTVNSVFAPKNTEPAAPAVSPVPAPKSIQPVLSTTPSVGTSHPERASVAHTVPHQNVCGVIGPQMVINGDIEFEGQLVIQGKVNGNITCHDDAQSVLQVDENAEVVGDVSVPVIKVAGALKGNVSASELLHIHPSGVIEGPVKYNNIHLESGGTVAGSLSPDFKNARK